MNRKLIICLNILLLTSCTNCSDKGNMIVDDKTTVDIWNKKFYGFGLNINGETVKTERKELEKTNFYYFYKDLCLLWYFNFKSINNNIPQYDVEVCYFKILDSYLFTSGLPDDSGSKVYSLNDINEITDSFASDFYKSVPYDGIKYFSYRFEVSENTLTFQTKNTDAFYCTIDVAKELGFIYEN